MNICELISKFWIFMWCVVLYFFIMVVGVGHILYRLLVFVNVFSDEAKDGIFPT
jgi:hypothetical protein